MVVWHDIINNSINSHRTNNYRACTAEELTEILKTLTNISAIVYCQRNGTPDIKNQLISSGILVIPITKCLISKRMRRTELVNEYQALHQDVQLELKSLRIVFEHQDNLPAVLSKLPSNTKKKSQSRRRAQKIRLVNRGEETVGPTDEEASTERVSQTSVICVALCHVRFIPPGLQTNDHSCTPTSNLDLVIKKTNSFGN